ncbi:hypothetical protein [Helicovermis profundi]|uniref:Uncharacterized protein n=1 Tax=Helicovermis profundi TaxID=3065157 RepID=A0AAU9EHB6_9FIRM|nr:hypothetical protein HLPR_12090 [Clostridia bacterium S502]
MNVISVNSINNYQSSKYNRKSPKQINNKVSRKKALKVSVDLKAKPKSHKIQTYADLKKKAYEERNRTRFDLLI